MHSAEKPPKPVYAGIFLLASSIILFEIALTRVFAIMMWHHFTYMVVSMALLGFGAAGSILTARRATSVPEERPAGAISKASLAYGFSVMLAFCFVTLVRLDSLLIWEDKSNILALLLIYMIISVPFVFGGLAVGQVLTAYVVSVNRLYFADLVGSALGGAASVLLLRHLGGTTTLILAGAMGVAAGLLFAFAARARHVVLGILGTALAAVIVIGFLGGSGMLRVPALAWDVPFAPGKEAALTEAPPLDRRIFSATAEVEVSVDAETAPMIGGNYGRTDATKIHSRFVAQDGTAPTMLYRDGADISKFPFLDDTQAATAYVCHEARGATKPKVLIIGVGGGPDVMVALAHDAAAVTAVEINTAMIEMVTEHYDDYLGGLFRPGAHPFSDRLRLVNGEGRHYARSHEEKYDIIQMSGVDSFTALNTGAYTLSESYLYTVEAVKEFYEKLEDQGYINYSRFILNRPKLPRETLRLSNIAHAALGELGVSDPAAHIVVFQGFDWASTIIKKGPFTRIEIDRLEKFAAKEGFKGLVFDPLQQDGEGYGPMGSSVVQASGFFANALENKIGADWATKLPPDTVTRFADAYACYIRGDTYRGEDILNSACDAVQGPLHDQIEAVAFGWVSAAAKSGLAESTDFFKTRDDFKAVLRGSDESRHEYVANYEYDLSPCRDDQPFFFNYYRFSAVFGGRTDQGATRAVDERYHSDFPVGHMVLLASMIQIVLLAAFMIFWPLRSLARAGVPTPGKFRYLAYFSSLGLGFMLIEIAMMQKLVIFLGHPTYALSVVLASLLGFAGLGSFLAERIRRLGRGILFLLLLAIVGVVAFEVYAVNHLLPELLGLSLEARIGVTIAMLLPLGIVLGMPFPSGMRIVKEQCPALLPWTWAINGFCSVFASVFAIVLSMQIGFTKVFFVGAAIYAVGILFMKPEAKRREHAVAATLLSPTVVDAKS